ncbi:Retrovirus-related Pol polyprotein from transposon 412 [Vitis vinifera]|uniref:Retrovirus-related Pol polyprotein from transposon 412 n=1 Tax=Vitis vinifera TaxID=29760 RepID=A0A438GZG7_VITVI|nr:Retrovirus-related Pol polyprotein from transposon 412 [Vitis vinifera]
MVDATTGHEVLSFMDGSSGYNQIRMAPKDEEFTAFHTLKGIYYYKVISFGLKNAGVTYQCAMPKIFDDMLYKNVECYVDDLVVKSRKREDHLRDLCMVFDRLRRYQLEMHPLKCAFGITSRRCQPFNRLVKKNVPFVWDKACHNAFESIKKYLVNPSILGALMVGKSLILYIAA